MPRPAAIGPRRCEGGNGRVAIPGRPDFLLRVCLTLIQLWRFDEAEAMLEQEMQRFPDVADLAVEHGRLALRNNRFEEADRRFAVVRERFPQHPVGWIGGGFALRYQFESAEADAVLEEGIQRLPNEPDLALDYALVPLAPVRKEDRDHPEAVRRLGILRERFPAFARGRAEAVRALWEADRYDEADAWAVEALAGLSDYKEVAIAWATVARERGDASEAVHRFCGISVTVPR